MTREFRIREALTHWGFWMFIAYIGLVFTVAFTVSLYARTVKRDSARDAAVQRCLDSRPQLRKISTHLRGVNFLANVLVMNGAAVVASTPRGDPQYRTRVQNLRRITVARDDIAAVKSLPVPTVAQCKKMRP